MKFLTTIIMVAAVATVDVIGLPIRLQDTASKDTTLTSNQVYFHNVLNPEIFARKVPSDSDGSPYELIQAASRQVVEHRNHLEEVASTNAIHKHVLVRRIWEKKIKAAHQKASDAHTKAAAAHRQVQEGHANAAMEHHKAGNHIAAHDEKIEARKHGDIALAHQKASIPHLNEAHPDLPRVKATVPQAIKSIILSKYDTHKAKKSLKKVMHRSS